MKIRYINSFDYTKNIGAGINEVIAEMPEDCYICLRDGDSMFLTPDWGIQIRQIITDNPNYDLIGCVTNRLNVKQQLPYGLDNDTDIEVHVARSEDLWAKNGAEVITTDLIGGMFMLFKKSLWNEIKFTDDIHKAIQFDRLFCETLLEKGYRIGIAQGLYIWHTYRIKSKFLAPFDKQHLNPYL